MDTDAHPVAPPAAAAAGSGAVRIILDPRLWLACYLAVLAAIAFWPVPVDRDAGPILQAISRLFPWLTYDVIEFTANVLLFVPFGVLLTLILRRRWLVLPIALTVTIVIEACQALMLAERTSAVSDVIANLLGAAIGMLGVIAVATIRARQREVEDPRASARGRVS